MAADKTLFVAWGWGLVGGHWGRHPGGGDGKDACGRSFLGVLLFPGLHSTFHFLLQAVIQQIQ